jgi:hypothetical protein
MNRLFLLGLLLTGNVPDAERCLVVAFDICIDGAVVRRQWAPSWARRSVIKSAIRIMSPKLADNCNFSRGGHEKEIRLDMEHLLDEVCNLPIFDRFVFVISILESFPCCECSVLLNSTPRDVLGARIRAVGQLARCDEIRRATCSIGSRC